MRTLRRVWWWSSRVPSCASSLHGGRDARLGQPSWSAACVKLASSATRAKMVSDSRSMADCSRWRNAAVGAATYRRPRADQNSVHRHTFSKEFSMTTTPIAFITGASRGSRPQHRAAPGRARRRRDPDLHSNAAEAQAVVGQIEALGRRAVALQFDVGDSQPSLHSPTR